MQETEDMPVQKPTLNPAEPGYRPENLAREIFALLEEKKARDLVLMDLEKVNPYFSIFLIATASSQVQLKSLVRDIHRQFHAALPSNSGGIRPDDVASGWVIVDFIDVVVHLFIAEQREFYKLERLWGDGNIILRNANASPLSSESESARAGFGHEFDDDDEFNNEDDDEDEFDARRKNDEEE